MAEIDFLEKLKKLPKYTLEIGVFESDDTTERDEKTEGITNAELMFIHENGSPLNHIPSRPVLQMTIDHTDKELLNKYYDKCIDAYLTSNFDEKAIEKQIDNLSVIMENYAKDIIYNNDGRLKANADITINGGIKWVKSKKSKYPSGKIPIKIKGKGFNHPLFVTGQLARSIKCRFIKSYR